MSAVIAALRYAERPDNEGRAFALKLQLRYGRTILGTTLSTHQSVHQDGGIAIRVWKNDEETDELIFISVSEVLWCHIEWWG